MTCSHLPPPTSPLLLAAALLLAACAGPDGRGDRQTVRFWALGREGEVVQQLVPEFERRNPGVRVQVQQIPWTAAHEKLLTAFVGGATPDLAQLGNTWVPELAAVNALEPLDAIVTPSRTVAPGGYFPGIWATNVVDGRLYGVPWYVDTRVLFYRTDLLKRAGYERPPQSWAEWAESMRRVRRLGGPTEFAALLPLNEWEQLVTLGLQAGSPLLRDGGRRGAFRERQFRDAFEFYVGLYKEGLAPALANTQISSVYQEFARARFAYYITGPWNLGEFRRRLPPEAQDKWATAPLPGPGGPERGVSFAGGSSLVIFRGSPNKAAAWRFVEYLSEPAVQLRFYELTGDLPARTEAWRAPALAADANLRTFGVQLERAVPLPQVPEWELIAQRVAQYAEQAARGRLTVDAALARLDDEVDRTLEKRRWMLDQQEARGVPTVVGVAGGGPR